MVLVPTSSVLASGSVIDLSAVGVFVVKVLIKAFPGGAANLIPAFAIRAFVNVLFDKVTELISVTSGVCQPTPVPPPPESAVKTCPGVPKETVASVSAAVAETKAPLADHSDNETGLATLVI